MGSALAERALRAGFSVTGFDINAARRRALRRIGGHPVVSATQVADSCRRILFSLPTTDVVESVIREMGDKLIPASTIIDTTTGAPAKTAALASRLAKRRVRYLDATIVGSSAETRAGQAIVLVGGASKTFAACRDLFDSFARQSFHVGECGSGARMKLVVNLVLGLNRAVLAEGLAFAASVGVSPARALEILKAGAAYSRAMDTKGGKMIAGDFRPQAKLSQHLKDVRLILALGRGTGAKLPLSALHRQLLERLEAAGHGELDNSAILKAFE
jgi:3-hydroxyisobutyrate dehydrogenase-like beta-hydroxyacid dehydrogenase